MDLQSTPQIGYDWISIEEERGSGDDSDFHDSEDEDWSTVTSFPPNWNIC